MENHHNSDGAISPTELPNGNRIRSSLDTPAFGFFPTWNAPVRANSIGYSRDPFAQSSSNGGLRAGAAAFQPSGSDVPSHMRFLSLHSTLDGMPTIVSSGPAGRMAVQEPIGTKSANSSPVYPKAWFTTDIDPNKPSIGGHFLLIQGLKEDDLDHGVMALIYRSYAPDIIGKKIIKQSEDDEHIDVVLYIDDVVTSSRVYGDLDSNGMLTISYVSHDWYNAGQGVRSGSVDIKTMYVGQVTFIAQFKGRTADYDPSISVYDQVRHVAENFGVVSAFEQNKSSQYPLWQFRVEYFKISHAELAMSHAGDGVKLDKVNGWIVFAKQYTPPTGSPPIGSKKSIDINAVQAVALPPSDAQIVMSPTGRTAWYTTPDGIDHPVPPPRPVANIDRGVGDADATSWKGKEVVRQDNYHSAPPAQRPFVGHQVYNGQWPYNVVAAPVQGNELSLYQDNQPRGQDVVQARILDGQDVRTTVMLRNIPNTWDWRRLKDTLDMVCQYRYNFSYLRIDFKENKNVGYAFVNFENALDICNLVHGFVGRPWDPDHAGYTKPKLVQISYATIQGLDSLIEKFRNSSIMDELPDYRPMLFQTAEEQMKDQMQSEQLRACGLPSKDIVEIGERKSFPEPNNRAKKERSTANAGQIGLFSPRTVRAITERSFRSQYDRGTPAQLMEHHNHLGSGLFIGPHTATPVMAPTHIANYDYATPRFQAVYPPSLNLAYPHAGVPFMTAPPLGMTARPAFMPDTPLREIAGVAPFAGLAPIRDRRVSSLQGYNGGPVGPWTERNGNAVTDGPSSRVNGHLANGNGASRDHAEK